LLAPGVVPAHGQTVTATIGAGTVPWAVAVNPVTNQIYVANKESNNVVTVIDGATKLAMRSSELPALCNPDSMSSMLHAGCKSKEEREKARGTEIHEAAAAQKITRHNGARCLRALGLQERKGRGFSPEFLWRLLVSLPLIDASLKWPRWTSTPAVRMNLSRICPNLSQKIPENEG
jgi:hypothetical protein